MPPECGEAISELRTLGSLIDVLSEHGERQAVLALQEEGAESWSYSELAGYARRLTAKATNPKPGSSRLYMSTWWKQ